MNLAVLKLQIYFQVWFVVYCQNLNKCRVTKLICKIVELVNQSSLHISAWLPYGIGIGIGMGCLDSRRLCLPVGYVEFLIRKPYIPWSWAPQGVWNMFEQVQYNAAFPIIGASAMPILCNARWLIWTLRKRFDSLACSQEPDHRKLLQSQ